MPFVIEAEAVTTEYLAVVQWDHDDVTLEYFSQPQALKISYLGSDRVRRITTNTTADYLRITGSRIAFVECKREEELERLAKEQPGRYQRAAGGRWRSPASEVPDLGRGTFLHWRHLFDGKGAGLLHPTRRWCPSCLAEGSASSGDGLAQPLLWACTVVTHCPVHGWRQSRASASRTWSATA
jgi:hypothetical protein